MKKSIMLLLGVGILNLLPGCCGWGCKSTTVVEEEVMVEERVPAKRVKRVDRVDTVVESKTKVRNTERA